MLIITISRMDEDENDVKHFNIIVQLCPKVKNVIKNFNGDDDLMKDFLRIEKKKCLRYRGETEFVRSAITIPCQT